MKGFPIKGMKLDGPSGSETLVLLDQLGEGGFGVVYLAEDTINAGKYAVKFPRLGMFSDYKEMLAFTNEVEAATVISHPNVVRVLFVSGKDASLPYLVMEYLSDGTLKEELDCRRGKSDYIPWKVLSGFIRELISGMKAINARVLHRDLHPGNILFSGTKLKISDFGLSKMLGSTTRSHTFKAGQHIFYMAPEGWANYTNTIQTDMYSVGIVLFELITLNYPYDIPADCFLHEKLKEMHLFGKPKKINDFRKDIPTFVQQVVMKLLEKDPVQRYATWDEVESALEAEGSRRAEESLSPSIIDGILGEVLRIHDNETAKRLKEEEIRRKELERQEIVEYKIGEVLDGLDGLINEFNRKSSIGKIEIRHFTFSNWGIEIPKIGRISFVFFIPSEISIKGLVLDAAGYVAFPDKTGFNLLLCRQPNTEIYGGWKVALVRMNALAQNQSRPEPFGFNTSEGIKEIPRAISATHIYTVELKEWSPEFFFGLIEQLMRAR